MFVLLIKKSGLLGSVLLSESWYYLREYVVNFPCLFFISLQLHKVFFGYFCLLYLQSMYLSPGISLIFINDLHAFAKKFYHVKVVNNVISLKFMLSFLIKIRARGL